MKSTRSKLQTEIHNSGKTSVISGLPLKPQLRGPTAFLILAAISQTVNAGETPASPAPAATEADAFETLLGYATLYKDDSNPYFEEFKLRGRYQGQYWDVDADQGSASNWEDRRSRFGFDAKFLDRKLEARVDFQSNDGFDDFYDGLVDAYIRWKPVKGLSITVGKTKPLISQYDWLESTNAEPTFERSQIFNQLGINRATALTVEGTTGDYSWRGGIYSNDTPNSTADPITKVPSGAWGDGEFGDLGGGVSYSLGVGYDFKKLLSLDKADFRLDWLHSDREPGDLVLGRYDDILASTFILKKDLAGVVVEGFYASGGDGTNSNVFGFYIEPTYDIIPKRLQLVARYSFANSTGPFGVVAQSRYEKKVATGGGLGDSYNAFYGGIQYFIHGDNFKLLAGAEWSRLDGESGDTYDGVTLLTGIRASF